MKTDGERGREALSGPHWEVVPVGRTDGAPDWYALRVHSPAGGHMDFGFEPSPGGAVRRWSCERDVFLQVWWGEGVPGANS